MHKFGKFEVKMSVIHVFYEVYHGLHVFSCRHRLSAILQTSCATAISGNSISIILCVWWACIRIDRIHKTRYFWAECMLGLVHAHMASSVHTSNAMRHPNMSIFTSIVGWIIVWILYGKELCWYGIHHPQNESLVEAVASDVIIRLCHVDIRNQKTCGSCCRWAERIWRRTDQISILGEGPSPLVRRRHAQITLLFPLFQKVDPNILQYCWVIWKCY